MLLRVVFAGEIGFDLAGRRPAREGPADELHVILKGQAIGALGRNRCNAVVKAEREVNRVRDPAPRTDVLDQADSAVAFTQDTKAPTFERLEEVAVVQRRLTRSPKLCVQCGYSLRQRIDES